MNEIAQFIENRVTSRFADLAPPINTRTTCILVLIHTDDFLLIKITQHQVLLTLHRYRRYVTTCHDDTTLPSTNQIWLIYF